VKALVTGAAGGIGRAVCAALAADGYDVVGVDRVARDDPAVAHHVADLTDEEEVAGAVAAAGRIDLVFNGAGISGRSRFGDGPVESIPRSGWDAVLETNLTSVFLVCKHAIPALREIGRAHV